MAAIRRDVNQGGATWNETLIWYAKAVQHLHALPIKDRTSWKYLAAIHGINQKGWIAAHVLSPKDPLPPTSETEQMWDQCQHGTWYFLPWHRGYLAAFEAIVAKTVKDLGGPPDWALPYWNYLNADDKSARNIPQAFLEEALPDGSPNFLARAWRNGEKRLGPTGSIPDITLKCQDYHRFTSAPGTVEYGGGVTAFSHGGRVAGAVESNPHNLVHVMVGGLKQPYGFMSDPDYAALDPIFWIHHCNVDRLWAAWLTQSDNIQDNSEAWRNGPSGRGFVMPDIQGNLAAFDPGQTLPGGALAPEYDNLTSGTGAALPVASAANLATEIAMPAKFSTAQPPTPRVLGSNAEKLTVGRTARLTTVSIADPGATGPALLQAGVAQAGPQRYFLHLEGIRGNAPSGVLKVSIGATGAAARHADTVALFGLANASAGDGPHGGNGLGATIDITEVAQGLLDAGASLEQLHVAIEQPEADVGNEITVDRVSVVAQNAG
ncbi:Tyrosinase [Delftia tsuruhatensis]|uniref:tyrosinase family protein n=1 Tax=Delftia tsuruhatensis TaxID=180282 RepID=UPI001E6BB0F5|nr:tyrosinase family protein [Delftia tsuruhatensis]CAB5688998.1 Tyrosinase [Delftia tsuruhatensis]CAC9691071.1 Tyrosinase [Delftia tsuruhatensis]